MADIILEQGQSLPEGMQTRYREMADGTYALVVATEVTNIVQMGGYAVAIDSQTGEQVVLGPSHLALHNGFMFSSSYKTPDAAKIADDGLLMMHLITIAGGAHLSFSVSSGGEADVRFYEDTIVSANGTALADVPMNRDDPGASVIVTFHTPTVTDVGRLLFDALLPGGTVIASGGSLAFEQEWILKANTHYLIMGINRAGSAQPMSIAAQWYVH